MAERSERNANANGGGRTSGERAAKSSLYARRTVHLRERVADRDDVPRDDLVSDIEEEGACDSAE